MYNFLIVGAGLAGAVMARELTNAGYTCFIIEKNNHIGGACYDRKVDNYYEINTSGHIFHTSNDKIWNWINQYGQWQQYNHKVKSRINDTVYSFPINLSTLHQLWGCITPKDAIEMLNAVKVKVDNPNANMEQWCLANIGEELYELFIYGYTYKQWGKYPSELPASIIKRLPLRMTYNDNYYTDTYQVMPEEGYTTFIENILHTIPIALEMDFLSSIRPSLELLAEHIIYTGPIDAFYDYCFGKLEYRSCQFDTQIYSYDYQGAATINYPSLNMPFTRKVEWQHFYGGKATISKVMTETPSRDGIPYYPIRDIYNTALYDRYATINPSNVTFVGRLATYRYMDMDQVIGQCLSTVKGLLA